MMASLPPVYRGVRRRYGLELLASALLQAACLVGFAALLRLCLDEALQETTTGVPLPVMLTALLAVAVLGALGRLLERHRAEQLGQHYVQEIRLALFDRIAEGVPDSGVPRRGQVPLRFVNDLNALRQWISLGQVRLVVCSLLLLACLTYLLVLDRTSGLIVAGLLALYLPLTLWLGQRLAEAVRTSRQHRGRLANLTAERIQGMDSVLAFNRLPSERRRLDSDGTAVADAMVDRAFWTGSLRASADFCFRVALLLVVAVQLWPGETPSISPGQLMATLSLVALLGTPLLDLARVNEFWQAGRVAAAKLSAVLAAGPAQRARPRRRLRRPRGHLELRGLQVTAALAAFDGQVDAGGRVWISGPAGSGKTTLLQLIAGLRSAQGGRVRIDGVPVDRLTRTSRQRAVALASSDLPLIKGSLRRNLRYGAPRASDDELSRLCLALGLDRHFGRAPDLLELRVQEGGSNLSNGQQALVQLGRALAGRPAVLLLDDLSARLDRDGRERLDALLDGLKATVLRVRCDADGAIASCDQRWVFEAERVRCEGPVLRAVPEPACLRKATGPLP